MTMISVYQKNSVWNIVNIKGSTHTSKYTYSIPLLLYHNVWSSPLHAALTATPREVTYYITATFREATYYIYLVSWVYIGYKNAL